MIIYKITNLITGKIYIGQTVQSLNDRWLDHKSNSRYPERYTAALYCSMRKHGLDNFKIEEIDSANTLEELNAIERTYIKALNCMSPNGYNLLQGGDRKQHHPETREKIRQKLKGRPIKNRWTGGNPNPPSEEHKAKMSAMWKGKPNKVLFKKVLCSNGMEFESVNAAAKHFNLNRVTVTGLLKSGKIGRCGHSFKFL